MLFSARHRVLVAGKTRHGKTTLVKELLRANAGKFAARVVFDVDAEYRSKDGRVMTTLALAQNPTALGEKGTCIVARPVGESPAELARDVRFLLRLVRSRFSSTKPVLVVLEEPGRWAHLVRELLDEASISWAKHGIALVFVSQRAALVPKTTRTQLSTIISFKQDEPSDLDALCERAGEAFASSLPALRVGQYRVWKDDDAATLTPQELPQ